VATYPLDFGAQDSLRAVAEPEGCSSMVNDPHLGGTAGQDGFEDFACPEIEQALSAFPFAGREHRCEQHVAPRGGDLAVDGVLSRCF
jgi:hypothetical protein